MNQRLPALLLKRRNLLAAVIILSLGVVGLRFFQLQIFHHDQYVTYAENNSIREVRLPAPRGMILDRNGNFLVTNRPQYSLEVIPAEVRRSLTELAELDRYLEITQEEIHDIIEEADGPYEQFQPVTLYESVSFTQRSYLEEHRLEFPGIFFVDRAIRHYPSRARATHIIGYLRNVSTDDYEQYRSQGYYPGDVVGSAGLEREYERFLRGEDGYRYHLVDYLLRDLGEVTDKPTIRPIPGQDLHLALDIDLQALGEMIMEGKRGALIAMEPKTGEVLAYVSAPDYVLAPFTGPVPVPLWEQWRDHPDKILLDRVADGLYPPGSIFKLVAVAAALGGGQVVPEDTVGCNGVYRFGNRLFHCNIWPGHGQVNMEDAVRLSCNIYFYKLIQWIGFDAWAEMAREFGFGSPTGVELPQESVGLVPTPKYMDRKYNVEGWTAGHLLNLVLGQGDLLVTPLQIARMTVAIANGGRLVTPKLVVSPRLKEVRERAVDLPSWIWGYMHKAMYQVVNGEQGTGFRARVDGGAIYGKTGTAQNPHGEGHSWFSGFVKTESGRELVVTILVEQGGLGSRTAAPLAAEVFRFFIERYGDAGEELAQIP
ncbi:MAG: penicillin-binding protein 2 [Fidelibacterota bacterium]|nr:MAG: penicillin-binding protein 2 [Candidatus Neomarinimicrobiota bacterium]